MRWGSLRSRLTLLVTVAVALAIAISAGACFMIVRKQLYDQVDRALVPSPAKAQNSYQKQNDLDWLMKHCTTSPEQPTGRYRPPESTQVIYSDGRPTCHMGPALTITPYDLRIAAQGGRSHLHNGTTADGTPMRILTENVGPGMAVMDAKRIDQLKDTLRNVALLLGAVAALGVLGAAWAGMAVARAGLAPVGRLTKAVEHIAQTEDLDTRIPVEGTDEIARLSASFNAMTASLAGSRDRQHQLVADAGHELRTPLTTLRTNIDLLLRSEQTGRQLDPGAKERLLVNVKAQFAELSTLVGDLLQLARGDTDHEPHVEVALHDVVRAAVDRARLRGAEVTTDLEPWYVVGNAASLERAVLNLIDNAGKFGPGQVEVGLHGGTLTVRDHGPGIPEEDLPHVFERFWRSPSARGLPGSGLGLAIVAQAVAEAGGDVRLANAPDGGVIATITLPGDRTSPS
ncbi:sensor histidine kinase [Nonomuraea cavernae]|uniref:histidine kinase n=1 Tax=Nonomuraea cavernae TaxID=2045107 RepID=A0A917Z9E3_9ACTN|nr:HAMP domain-containing sensor histidine kinase [Nonomuraea cavernae]MCA2189274.1 HAMP domain-containing histidine kinase [Nonomuraea cavernae]GGO76521.1 two-component sensor histidine kinase [Nonomuraea cavernae]